MWRDRADYERMLHKLKYPNYKFEPRQSSEINRRDKKLAKRAHERASSPSTIGEDAPQDFGAAYPPVAGTISQESNPESNFDFNFNSAPEPPIGSMNVQQQFGHEKEEDDFAAMFGTGASPEQLSEEQFGYEPLGYGQEGLSMFSGAGIEKREEYIYGQDDFSKLDEVGGDSQQKDGIETDQEFYARLFEMDDNQ